jgi:hypothetical protein
MTFSEKIHSLESNSLLDERKKSMRLRRAKQLLDKAEKAGECKNTIAAARILLGEMVQRQRQKSAARVSPLAARKTIMHKL